MIKSNRVVMIIAVLVVIVVAGAWAGRGKFLDSAADKVIQKFQGASCEQLQAKQGEPKSIVEKAAVAFLRSDSQARVAFIDKIAAPVMNKMIECGLIP
jgi:hypothetical protein